MSKRNDAEAQSAKFLTRFVKSTLDFAARRAVMHIACNPTQREILAKLVRAAIFARRIRDESFPVGLFGEPAWDCLLDVYLAFLEQRSVSVSDVCVAASVPPTTALRWIDTICEMGLTLRRSDPRDGRRTFVELTRRGEVLMNGYFDRVPSFWNGC